VVWRGVDDAEEQWIEEKNGNSLYALNKPLDAK
jgi:hypothetical protein